MPNVNDISESKYVAKEDVGTGKTVTIAGYKRVDVSRDCDPTSIKFILLFKPENECKPLVLNKTNGKKIARILGSDEFDDWIGKTIVLWNNPDIEFQGETVGGVRVKAVESAKDENIKKYTGNDSVPSDDGRKLPLSDDDIPY